MQKHPDADDCPCWTPEQVEELRSSLLTNNIAEVDTEMFGQRFSEIILRSRNPKKRSQRSEAIKENKFNEKREHLPSY